MLYYLVEAKSDYMNLCAVGHYFIYIKMCCHMLIHAYFMYIVILLQLL